ncbi:MAG: sterol desaturase family protein [Pseudomonadota bacterium]
MLEQFKAELITIAYFVIDPNKRLFIGYLLAAILFAFLVYIMNSRQKSKEGFIAFIANPKVWLHKSALLDYQLFVVNRIVRAFFWAPLIITMVPIAMAVSDGLEWMFGSIPPISQSDSIIIFLFTLTLFLFDDLTRFLLHYAFHKVPFLWEFHKVHHSARVLTPLTVYRSHPIESFMYACRMGLAQGCAVGICYYLFGPNLSMADILGANVFIFIFNVMGSNLRHSHVKWGWGAKIEKWFISPLQHQIHHSRQVQFHDKNFGTSLAVWDRIFGSLTLSGKTKYLVFGLDNNERSHKSVVDAYLRPFISCKNKLTHHLKKPPKEIDV